MAQALCLTDLVSLDFVVFDLAVKDKTALLSDIAQRAAPLLACDAADLFAALAEREAQDSTALGHGVAIPHARLRNIDRPLAYLVKLAQPLAFDAPDGIPVSICCVLFVPYKQADDLLTYYGLITQQFARKKVREAMQVAPSSSAFYQAFTKI